MTFCAIMEPQLFTSIVMEGDCFMGPGSTIRICWTQWTTIVCLTNFAHIAMKWLTVIAPRVHIFIARVVVDSRSSLITPGFEKPAFTGSAGHSPSKSDPLLSLLSFETEYFIGLQIKNEKVSVQRHGIKFWTVCHKKTVGETLWGVPNFFYRPTRKCFMSIKQKYFIMLNARSRWCLEIFRTFKSTVQT